MAWPKFILVFIFTLTLTLTSCSNLCQARRRHHKLPSAVIVGTVYCDTCFQDVLSKAKHYISGATVAVECEERSSRSTFYKEVKTDKQGTFKVSLPFPVSKHEKEIQGCNVKLVKSSEPYCAVASTANSSNIHLKQKTRNKHIFSAGFFTFKPLKQPDVCNQQIRLTNQNLLIDPLTPLPNLPGLPGLPMPTVPETPANPQIHTIPHKEVESSEEKRVEKGEVSPQFFFFPPIVGSPSSGILPPNPLQPAPLLPNPFQPPPAPLIPNPFQPPSPPPTLLPPVPQLPPLPPLPNVPGLIPAVPTIPTVPTIPGLPGVPGLTPTPTTPPVAPAVPTIPGIPLPPILGIPIPPLSGSAKKSNP